MASGYLAPMLITTGVSFGNHLYNTGSWDFKILIMGAVATGILGLVNEVPGMSPVAAGIAWIALIGELIGAAQKPSPVENLLKITGSGK